MYDKLCRLQYRANINSDAFGEKKRRKKLIDKTIIFSIKLFKLNIEYIIFFSYPS